MHPKLQEFLNGPSNKKGLTNLMYLAELIAVNGGSIDIGSLVRVPNDTVWGRKGLIPNEALDLTGMIQFAWGILFTIEQDLRPLLFEVIQKEITRREARSSIYIPTTEEQSVFGKQRTAHAPTKVKT